MPRAALSGVSLKQLVGELRRRQSKLAAMVAQRDALNRQIEALQDLMGVEAAAAKAPAATKPAKQGKKTRLRAAGKPLADYVRQVLAKAAAGLSVKEIEAKVRSAGYPTKAKSIYNPIMKVLAKGFTRVERGVYAMQAAAKAARKAAKAGPGQKRGVFKESGEAMVLRLLKRSPLTTAEINAAWKKAGRAGTASATLSNLNKEKKLSRGPLPDGGKGFTYSLA